ncbi:MAG: hypothetical protein IPI10_19110 [Bacteroidetes bacterium]|nr:hypothetical protein [Bacteroidota bacterium]
MSDNVTAGIIIRKFSVILRTLIKLFMLDPWGDGIKDGGKHFLKSSEKYKS